MTALPAAQSSQAVRTRPAAKIDRRRIRVFAAGVASFAGGAVLVFASTAAVALEYYSILGTAFRPVSSTTPYTYEANGCIYQPDGTPGIFNAPVILPPNSTIKSIYLYYYDASAGDMNLFLVRYIPGASNSILATATSVGTQGPGLAASPDLNEVFSTVYAYDLRWVPSFANSGQQICGAYILYLPPAATAASCSLDADGNGAIDALSDGILILRAMFGLTGTAVTNNALGGGMPSRTTWPQLRSFFNGSCGASFAQ